jgi:peptidylprolyl isomerase
MYFKEPPNEFEFQNIYQRNYDNKLYPDQNENRPMTFFDISIDGIYIGRIIFELFTDVVPKTCENFRYYCVSHNDNNSYYKTKLFKIIPNYAIQGGDITRNDGRGGYSIYGQYFEDENFRAKHKIEGLLTMANTGPNTNNSQFMITLFPLPWLDGKHVVFGRVIKGYEVCRKIEEVGSQNGVPKKKVIIEDCGEIGKNYGINLDK